MASHFSTRATCGMDQPAPMRLAARWYRCGAPVKAARRGRREAMAAGPGKGECRPYGRGKSGCQGISSAQRTPPPHRRPPAVRAGHDKGGGPGPSRADRPRSTTAAAGARVRRHLFGGRRRRWHGGSQRQLPPRRRPGLAGAAALSASKSLTLRPCSGSPGSFRAPARAARGPRNSLRRPPRSGSPELFARRDRTAARRPALPGSARAPPPLSWPAAAPVACRRFSPRRAGGR
jgi:hypothetical protein